MQKKHLARYALAGAGWAHPYATGPFDPWLYADGGDGGDSGTDDSGNADDGGDADDDQADDAETGGGADDEDQGEKPKPKPPAKKPADDDPAATIARLQKELKTANGEAAKARTSAKKAAADEARTEIVQELGKALGLIKDDKDTPPDPAALTAQIEKATATHRETAVELAVYRGASKHGADPDALTDSRAFLRSIADLDPADEGFSKKVNAAIKQAVADNPKLKAASPAPGRMGADFSGGSGGKAADDDSIDAHRERRRKQRGG
ncbi:hypothetical protein [Streptomyces sp. Tu6071]|uniref:hypothetical protein n=1 Tax=Streptomyces sp. Tu6071 TaxID=355249 RepID=UPI0002E38462|nr:hypothetical protein [Streptomyces sp. Tu6071]